MSTAGEILKALSIGEEVDWEFKSARGGLPGSLWETYSAMANTDGGVIVLGVEQRGEQFSLSGLPDPARMRKNFWDTINNRLTVASSKASPWKTWTTTAFSAIVSASLPVCLIILG